MLEAAAVMQTALTRQRPPVYKRGVAGGFGHEEVPMSRFKVILSTLTACALAGAVWAQNADPNTAGPTRNDYRLRLVQPLEGASIVGETIQVVVDTEIPAERDTRQDVNSMPRPRIEVFLDELYRGTMTEDRNVMDLDRVSPGPHEIVLLARNMSGEIIDRRVVHVTATAPRIQKATMPEPPAPVAAAPQAPAPAPPPAPEPVTVPVPAPAGKLPAAGTANMALLVGGLLLLAAGFAACADGRRTRGLRFPGFRRSSSRRSGDNPAGLGDRSPGPAAGPPASGRALRTAA
jgi:hypothetical protein